jgi:hypothetical protein
MSSKSRGGLSKREYDAQHGGGSSGSSSSGVKPFKYSSKDEKKDRKKAEEDVKPFYTQQISDTMEDLNAWIETESINYNRTLRQGRARMAQMGAAIGTQRDSAEAEVTQDSQRRKQANLQRTERQVGSGQMTQAGFGSQYGGNRVGSITDEMNASIEEQALWYKGQKTQKYYGNMGINYGNTA